MTGIKKTIVDILLIIGAVVAFPFVIAWIIWRLRNNKPINPFGPTPEEIAHAKTYNDATSTYTTATTQNTAGAAQGTKDITNATSNEIEKNFNSTFDPTNDPKKTPGTGGTP